MKQQAVLQLSSFSFFVIGWIHQSLHSFNCGALQALIRITAQVIKNAQAECIVVCSAQFSDQLRLSRSRCTSDHDYVASPTPLVAPLHFVACRVGRCNLACRRCSIPKPTLARAMAWLLFKFFQCFFVVLRSETEAPVLVPPDEILVPLG